MHYNAEESFGRDFPTHKFSNVSKGDKGFKRHSQAMVTIEKLALEAPSFGQAKKTCLINYDKISS